MTIGERTLEQVERLIGKAEAAIKTYYRVPGTSGFPDLDSQASAEWRTQTLAFMTHTLGEDDSYTREFREKTERYNYKDTAETGIGILRALQDHIEHGYLQTYRQLVAADLFTDFFEQAEHLLDNGYHHPAASLAGAALENGLKEIARDRGIALASQEDLSTLSGKLADKEIINRLEQKQLSVMADVRNAADHGEFDRFDADDVAKLIRDAPDFLAKHAT